MNNPLVEYRLPLSQEAFARQHGITSNAVRRMEQGTLFPSTDIYPPQTRMLHEEYIKNKRYDTLATIPFPPILERDPHPLWNWLITYDLSDNAAAIALAVNQKVITNQLESYEPSRSLVAALISGDPNQATLFVNQLFEAKNHATSDD